MKSFILWSAGVKTQDCQRFYSNHAALHKQRVIEADEASYQYLQPVQATRTRLVNRVCQKDKNEE